MIQPLDGVTLDLDDARSRIPSDPNVGQIIEDRRYEIFISSTVTGLEDARAALIEETVKLGHFPSAMELFFHAGQRDLDLIESSIQRADIFVLLVGAAYGSPIDDSGGASYTETEYGIAQKYGKPILAFFLQEDEATSRRESLGEEERRNDERYNKFRKHATHQPLGTARFQATFSLQEGVGDLVHEYQRVLSASIEKLRLAGRGGWVRGELYEALKGRAALGETASQNPFFRRFVQRLNKFSTLSQRSVVNRELKRQVAEFFLDQYLARLILLSAGPRANFFRFLFERNRERMLTTQ